MARGAWISVQDFLVASGWVDAVRRAGVDVDPGVQAEAESETLRRAGVDVRVLPCVHNRDPAVASWVRALDASVAAARQHAGARRALDEAGA